MKKILLLIVLITISVNSHLSAQNLVNGKEDLLKYFTFYNSRLKEKSEFRIFLEKGLYVMIFDDYVDDDSLKLHINRLYTSPILYQRHKGYISFEIPESSLINFKINYQGKLKPTGTFAKVHSIAQSPVGSSCPSFALKTINGKTFTNHADLEAHK